MLLWAVLAILTAAVVIATCLPLLRPGNDRHDPADANAEIYRAQLAEIEAERERGVLTTKEAEAARVEVSRRLLRAASDDNADQSHRGTGKAGNSRTNDWAVAAITVIIPGVALAGYLALGSPMLQQQPYSARAGSESPDAKRVSELVARVEKRLSEDPNDGDGWNVIAPVYLRQQKYNDAVFAFQQALRLKGESAARLEGLGEALVLRDNGRVSKKARTAFSRALNLNPKSLKARFWLALSDEQNGRLKTAAQTYKKILEDSPKGAPWRAMVGTRLAMVQRRLAPPEGRVPALSPDMMRAADSMSEEERAAMIEEMVAGLAKRLEADGNDLKGWLRLMRAYKVLGKNGEAKQAAASARENFRSDPDALKRINTAAQRLGLES